MLKKILLAIVAIIVILVIVIATRPDDFRIARSTTIAAPAAIIFPHVNDLHKWQIWSPWAKLDPTAKTSYEGPEAGKGAVFSWDGNSNIGTGRMTITDSKPNDLVQFRLDFEKPFKGTNNAEFTFQPQGDQTLVTWSMSGKSNFMTKAIGLFMNCDKMCGDQFNKGLADLKSLTEAEAKK
ncbi:MAG: SRPBCC family protein [Chthoniobacterales bacterium]